MKHEKNIFHAELIIVIAIIALILLPQLIGSGSDGSNNASKEHAIFSSVEDFDSPEVSIGTMDGSLLEIGAEEEFHNAKLVIYNDYTSVLQSLASGKVDGALYYAGTETDKVLAKHSGLGVMNETVMSMDGCFITQKNKEGAALAKKFDEFLSEIRQSGKYDDMIQKWESGETTGAESDALSFSGENGTLRIAFDPTWPVYSHVDNGEYSGLFLDMCRSFCSEYGYIPEFEAVECASELIGLEKDKYDMVADAVAYVGERTEVANFTQPVLTFDLVMLAKAENIMPEAGGVQDGLTDPENADGAVGDMASEDNSDTETVVTVSKAEQFWNNMCSSFEKNFIREGRWKMLLSGLGITLLLAFCAAAIGTLLAALICMMRLSTKPFVTAFARIYVQVFCGTPVVVLLLILYYVVFGKVDISAFIVCIIGFSLDFSAYVSEIMRMGINTVPEGQTRAARALGFSRSRAFVKVVLPQAVRHMLPVYRGQFISMVEMTSIAGYISVEDLTKVSDIIRSRTYEAFFPLIATAIIYFLMAWLLAESLKLIEIRTDPHKRNRMPKGVRL